MVDNRSVTGQFILTGSNAVDKTKIHHSGTGRISKLDMLPMSLWESGESNGKISLMELFNNPNLDIDGIESDLSVEELVFCVCRGGWPATVNIKSDITSDEALQVKLIVCSFCVGCHNTVDLWHKGTFIKIVAKRRKDARNSPPFNLKNSMINPLPPRCSFCSYP